MASNSPHEHMILRVDLVGSHGRWKRPWGMNDRKLLMLCHLLLRGESERRLEGGPSHPPGECKDYNDNCQNWAIMDECTKNAAYMVGADGSEGECKAACNKCKRPSA